jgi:peptidoglycan/LPS O-acetylase OafA/YrhL
MIPCLTSYSIYFFVKHTNLLGKNTYYYGPGERSFTDIFEDGLWYTWFGINSWIGVTWTLGVEFFATYFVYVLALVVSKYSRHSWLIYLLILVIDSKGDGQR